MKESKWINQIKEIVCVICVSYTIISIVSATLNALAGTQTNNFNTVMMLVFTTISVCVLYMYKLFSAWSPLLVITLQYVLATGLAFFVVFLCSLVDEISPNGYRDLFLSFTVLYILGAIVFYVWTYFDVKKMNKLLEDIHISQ
ncbi:MAG: hypothetical protein Q4D51_07285 [Eubacteriales bacterium]|nr:hypothetical protein [Eubacteriales bacterium]